MKKDDLLYVIPKDKHDKKTLQEILAKHQEIKFVSLVGIDFAGNDTDEKIPVKVFLEDMDTFLEGSAVQTDGSSVVLPGIASLNNARVDFKVDKDVNWFVDYNHEHLDENGQMVGTLRIPSFLVHNNVFVDSRSILKNTLDYVKKELLALFKRQPKISGLEHINLADIEDIVFTCATELEFWVKTPADKAPVEELSASQVLQEQYWQRTRGNVRTSMEQAIMLLEKYQLEPEMGHKEVGGVKAKMDGSGHLSHVMEQLEIDWKYSEGVQTADNELLARISIKEVFRHNGLEVTFQAKPIEGVAGNGKHIHICIMGKMKNGKLVNLFTPTDMKQDFVTTLGYGGVMGLLKNYEVINPFVTATNDSLNRLKPGFEAPVCIVTSMGHAPNVPTRNRTILVGLVRDIDSPMATRFEVRSPNPFTNTYMALAVFYMTMLDGMLAVADKDMKSLEAALSKKAGQECFYLEKDREYRSEEDVFEDYTQEERDKLFGKPPATVWENLQAFSMYPEKVASLTRGNIIRPEFVNSFRLAAKKRWQAELLNRIIPDYHQEIIAMKPLHKVETVTDCDLSAWREIQNMRRYIAKDSIAAPSLFARIREAVVNDNYDQVSELQLEMAAKMKELRAIYSRYKRNIID